MNCRQDSAMAPEFNPVNHVKRRTRDGSTESVGKLIRYFELPLVRPDDSKARPPLVRGEGDAFLDFD